MRDLELYYEHYKETYALSKQAQLRRNKYYIVLCLLEALSFLFLINPDKVADLFSVGISSKLHTTLVLGNVTLQTLLWILIAYVNVRYCQDTLYVERLYLYINKIEKAISKISNSSIFNRESDEYTRNYPMVLNFIDLF